MNLREALQRQAPSLALQRSAADEIARLDALLAASAASAVMRQALTTFEWIKREVPGSTIPSACEANIVRLRAALGVPAPNEHVK